MPNGYHTLMLPQLVSQADVPNDGAGAAAAPVDSGSATSSSAAAVENHMAVWWCSID